MARAFNGTNDSLEGASAPVTAFPFTMACWCRPSTTSGQILMSLGVSGGIDRATLVIGGASVASAGSNNSGAGASSVFAGTAGSGAWVHVAGVFETDSLRTVYFNGSAGTPATDTVPLTGINRINLGARYNTTLGAYFSGSLAEVGIWNLALSADDILSLSDAFKPDRVRPSALRFYSRLIRNVQDLSGGIAISEMGTGTTVSEHPRIIYP